MPDGSDRSVGAEDARKAAEGKAAKSSEKPRKSAREIKAELKKKKEAEAERRRAQAKERSEATQRAGERTKAAVEKVVQELKAPKITVEAAEESTPVIPSKDKPVIVESYPHLANSTREQVVEALAAANVDVTIPSETEWKKMGSVQREKWLEKHGIENVTKLPKSTGKYTVEKYKDGISILGTDPSVVSPEVLQKLIGDAGLEFNIDFPKDYESMQFQEKLKWLKENKVSIIPAISGGSTRWPLVNTPTETGNSQADLPLVYERLALLRREEEVLGAPLAVVDDREELWDRLASFDILARTADFERVVDPRQGGGQSAIFDRLREIEGIEANNPAAFAAGNFDREREMYFDHLIRYSNSDGRINDVLERVLTGGGVDQEIWRKYLNRISDQVVRAEAENNNYRFVFNAASAIEDFEKSLTAAGNVAGLDSVLNPAQRDVFKNARTNIDAHFRGLYARYRANPEDHKLLFGPIETEAVSYRNSIRSGLMATIGEVEGALFEGGRGRPAVEVASRNEPAGEKGITEWHAVNLIQELKVQHEGEQEMGVPVHWRNSLKNVKNNLRFAESGDFSQEDLGSVRNRVVQIAESLRERIDQMTTPVTDPERIEAERQIAEINELKDSVLAIYDLRLAMEGSDMNPQKVLEHFGSHIWKDTTFQVYFKRFDQDENDVDFEDRAHNKFNMQDKAMQMFFRRLAEEKRMLNQLEALTIVDISQPLSAASLEEMLNLVGRSGRDGTPRRLFTTTELTTFEQLRTEMVTRMTTDTEKLDRWGHQQGLGRSLTAAESLRQWANPDAKAIKTFNMKEVVSEWYKEKTLLGAWGTIDNPADPNVGGQRLDVVRGEMLEQFAQRLGTVDNVDSNRVDEYLKSGLLNQVMNNAYHLTWTMGAFSDYDGIRIWDRSKEWFTNNERGKVYKLGQYVFNNGTTWFNGRMVDHYTEFLQDENRGRPRDANHEFTKHMVGKRRGILGHNRLIVKTINDNLRNANAAIRDSMVAGRPMSFDELLDQKMKTIENHDKLDSADPYDFGWLRGASIEELLEDGELSLENLEWSKVFKDDKENVRKFNMADWWSDRAESHKFFATNAMQEYLKNPGTKFFFKMNREIFYSKREIRIQPWMKLVIPAHQELGKHWQEWWKLPYDMPAAETEHVIEQAARLNMLNYKYVHHMEDEYLGWAGFRGHFAFGAIKNLRYLMEMVDRNAREAVKHDWELGFLWPLEFLKVAGQQMVAQTSGK